jgi:hypothetical protein
LAERVSDTALFGPPPRCGRIDFTPGADDVELYRQGVLRVWRARSGYVVHVGGAALAELNERAEVVDAVIASPDDMRGYVDLVGILARSLHGRLRGRFHIHAGVVVDARGHATLIAGDGGAGKTTTTLALLQTGAMLAGDDVGFLMSRDDDIVVEALPRALHVGATTLAMFPNLAAQLRETTTTAGGKQIADVPPGDETVGVAFSVRRLVFPRIATTSTSARRLPPRAVLPRLLVASAMATWPSLPAAQDHLDVLGRLLGVPAYAVDLGPDAVGEPARIASALASSAAAAPSACAPGAASAAGPAWPSATPPAARQPLRPSSRPCDACLAYPRSTRYGGGPRRRGRRRAARL